MEGLLSIIHITNITIARMPSIIDKTKSVENVTEKINAFQTKKEENKNIKTEPISLFNKYKQKEKDNIKEKEIEQNIVKDEIKRKSENKYKKKEEITIKEKDKKTKNLYKISGFKSIDL